MIFAEEWTGKLKCQSDDKEAKPARYVRVSVPAHFIELKRIEGYPKERNAAWVSGPNKVHYGFSPFIEKRLREVFGEGAPPMDIECGDGERASVVSTGAVAEWLVEEQGCAFTARFTKAIMGRDLPDELALICDDYVVIEQPTHVAIKVTTIEQRMLVEVRYGEYAVQRDPRLTIDDLTRL